MEGSYGSKYSFIGEWYDSQASLIRQFYVNYFPTDGTLEMFERKNRKPFVRRVKVDGITLDKFYIGCTLHILGRLIKIVDFACENTRNKLQKVMEVIFVMIKPLPPKTTGKILTHLYQHGIRVTRMKMARLTPDDVTALYSGMVTDPSFPFLLDHLAGKLVCGLEVLGDNVSEEIFKIAGNKDPIKAEPGTIRALYGTDRVRNCMHIIADHKMVQESLEYFFPSTSTTRLRLTATLSNCTMCIVKPHAIREGKLGAILECIDDGGFDITALNMIVVENVNAAEFYEVYKGIVPEYQGMVDELSSGPCVAMELVSKDKTVNTAVEFRKLVGPVDPEIARLLRPHTLRAKFGNTKVHNAVHCSDLPEDGLLEVEYFFKILDL